VKQLGIIGAGAIGLKHAEAAREAGAAVRWVVDVNLEKARALAEKFGGEPCESIAPAINDPATDAIIVGVPNHLHREFAVASLDAGKDVLLEKPMALNAAECAQINAAAVRNDRVLQLGFAHRYTAVGRLARQIVDEGRLGEIYHAQAHLHLRRGVPGLGKWFTTKSISGGGALIDVGVHLIDLSLWILGHPEVVDVNGQVYSTFGRRMRDYVYKDMWAGPPDWDGVCDVEDAAHALVRFRNGSTLDLNVAWAGNFPEQAMPVSMMGFFGDRGGMTFELFGDHANVTSERDGALIDERFEAPAAELYRDQLAAFLQSMETRQVTGATGSDGEVVQRIVDDIYRSSLPRPVALQA
jgi:predicted dehydrogenase